jgi:hypothetical protein
MSDRLQRLRAADPRTLKSAVRARRGAPVDADSWLAGKRLDRAGYLRDALVKGGILTPGQAHAATLAELEAFWHTRLEA